jgi:phosphatidylglycerophosphatase A
MPDDCLQSCWRPLPAVFEMTVQQRLILLVTTGAGTGYVPLMPGTIGTLVAIPLSVALNRLATSSLAVAVVSLALAIACAIALSNKACEILSQKDPQVIVVDEIVGFLLANFLAPDRLSILLTSFILFRFFDIVKIFPADRLERLPGGAGVVLDDVAAGFYALVIVQLLLRWGWL